MHQTGKIEALLHPILNLQIEAKRQEKNGHFWISNIHY